MPIDIVILAAGKGSRMRSNKPKVLHSLAGRPMLSHVIDTAKALCPASITVVIGHGSDQIEECYQSETDINWAYQTEQLGTGHAVLQALPYLCEDNDALILYGDVPLVKTQTLSQLTALTSPVKLLTAITSEPMGYGRIIRRDEQIVGIVEEKDATESERSISEVNTGILCVSVKLLKKWLPSLSSSNAQKEYYLTDVIALAKREEQKILNTRVDQFNETIGVNDRQQMAVVERIYQKDQALVLMKKGVAISDPNRIDIRGDLTCGRDVSIDINVIFEGDVYLADGVTIEANCIIKNATIGAQSKILSHSVIDEADIKSGVVVGPFARLRPGTILADNSKVGNFVEIKKSQLGEGAKVNHLSYIGDADVGSKANIGAGTITCNYDGTNKHKTHIGEAAFIGSNTAIVAPVKIGKNATVAAGTVLVKDVPDQSLAVARGKQRNIKGWKPN